MTSDNTAQADLVSRIEAVPTILSVVATMTGMGFVAVAHVTSDRWIAGAVLDQIGFGLAAGGELEVETTICREVHQSGEVVVIENVAEEPAYCSHPTPALYGFQSYISAPIILPDGSFFGTLCAIDPQPRRLRDAPILAMFSLFADLIAFQIDAHRRLATSAASLSDERHNSELREQFIAVLGHDLRNPVASIDAGAKLLAKEHLSDRGRTVVDLLQSSIGRITGLIDNVVDFARGRLGGGIPVELMNEVDLRPILDQVVDECRSNRPDCVIDAQFGHVGSVRCDPGRIGQMLSNLVANALTHGMPQGPIRVRSGNADGLFELSVSNEGSPIPPETIEHLFKPFVRASARPSQQGLGLGLYIASEIARAHGGTLTASSDAQETRFTFRMPAV